jgi:hypothetical protein
MFMSGPVARIAELSIFPEPLARRILSFFCAIAPVLMIKAIAASVLCNPGA